MIYYSLLLFSDSEKTGEDTNITVSCDADAAQENRAENDETEPYSIAGGIGTGDKVTPDAAESQDSAKTRREVYNEFIRAHKDLFTEDTQRIISKRFKESKQTEEALRSAQAEIAELSQKLADSFGELCPPDEAFLADHPDFSLEKELSNKVFRLLYNAGIDCGAAYTAAHAEELIGAACESARESAHKEAVRAVLDDVRARGTRTREAAASLHGTIIKRDVSGLSRNERAELARRAMAGEKINFT